MIPTWDVRLPGDLTFKGVREPTPDAAVDGIGTTIDYEPLLGYTWADVGEVLIIERLWIQSADGETADASSFEDHATIQLERGGYTDDDGDEAALYFSQTLDCIEGGVVSLVRALGAAGFLTISSCRGHADHRNRYPQVSILGDRMRLGLLAPLIQSAGCGAGSGDSGDCWIYAPSVDRMIDLAGLVLQEAAVFDALGEPSWKLEAVTVLDDLDD